jgi:acetate---CoA ligase (ADP-forming)
VSDATERLATGLEQPAGHALDAVLRPTSVAVIGASADPTKRGHRAVRALQSSGFRGRIIPVNPAGGTLLGLPVARAPGDLDAPPDLVLVCTPAATVPRVLDEWAAAGARGAVVLAVGFREAGAAGERIEAEIAAIADRTGLRVLGPNTSGLLNVPLGLNLIGLDGVRAGPLALLVQSGNIALALVTEAARSGLGFSFVIGVGNEVDVRFDELLDFLAADGGTRGIAIHAEGFRDGRAFLAAAARAADAKPVVMIKGGRTERGGHAARSHTGAVAGSYDALHAGLRQAGVVEVLRTDELLPVLATLTAAPAGASAGRGVAILSDGGGQATLAIDDLHARGTPIAALAADTSERLRALLGPAAAVGNPVDLAGAADRDPAVFGHVLALLARDPAVGAALVVGLFGGYAIRFDASLLAAELAAAQRFGAIARDTGIPLVVHSLYAETQSEPLRALQCDGVAVVSSLEVACRCLHACVERRRALDRRARQPGWPAEVGASRHGAAPQRAAPSIRGGTPAPAGARATAAAAEPVEPGAPPDPLLAALDEDRHVLLETEARALLAPFGLPLVPARLCRTTTEVADAARELGAAVAVRVVSPSAPHKTDAGGVALGVAPSDAEAAAGRVFDAVHAWIRARGDDDPDIRGVLVSPMIARPAAELLVGVRRDPDFGPVLTVGAGGTGVEWLRDVATRVLPIADDDVDDMLDALRIAPVLRGHRGAPAIDRAAVVRAVHAVADCALACPRVAEIEVNPLFVGADGVLAIDVRVFLA